MKIGVIAKLAATDNDNRQSRGGTEQQRNAPLLAHRQRQRRRRVPATPTSASTSACSFGVGAIPADPIRTSVRSMMSYSEGRSIQYRCSPWTPRSRYAAHGSQRPTIALHRARDWKASADGQHERRLQQDTESDYGTQQQHCRVMHPKPQSGAGYEQRRRSQASTVRRIATPALAKSPAPPDVAATIRAPAAPSQRQA